MKNLEHVNFDAIKGYEAMSGVQPPMIDALQFPQYKAYPQDTMKLIPWFHLAWFVGGMFLTLYDKGKTRWGLARVQSKWIYDAALAMAIVGSFLDYVVTVNGTYLFYQKYTGLENNANIRRLVEVMERWGLNFAQGMLVLELFVVLPTYVSEYYYGRKEGNMIFLLWLVLLGGSRLFLGFGSWIKAHGLNAGLLDFKLLFDQLIGRKSREFQGGGPARAAVTY